MQKHKEDHDHEDVGDESDQQIQKRKNLGWKNGFFYQVGFGRNGIATREDGFAEKEPRHDPAHESQDEWVISYNLNLEADREDEPINKNQCHRVDDGPQNPGKGPRVPVVQFLDGHGRQKEPVSVYPVNETKNCIHLFSGVAVACGFFHPLEGVQGLNDETI
jgi:hypothetical protein